MKQPSWRGGAVVGAYRILSHLGSGGMGEVYLAEDTRLLRKVALKILPREVTNDPKRLERFEREARAASALNHPAIVTIHELGRDAGTYFIAGEFIEGETLRARMARERMPLRDALDVATQVAAALSAAHAAGIVHRDIKPENVMLRPDGYVKVLDFGLAKLMPLNDAPEDLTKTVQRATDPGTVVGTVHYMSPEQARGAPVDARSDLFSLGAMLYEMLAGRTPFEGQTSSHVIVSILEHTPPPLAQSAGDVPAELQRIVSKALEKNPEERYQTAKDLLIDLRHLKHELELSGELERMRTSEPVAVSPSRVSTVDTLVSGIRAHKRAALVTALLVVFIAAAALFVPPLLRDAESGGERIPIAVADFDNQTGEKALDGLSGMLITSLEQSRRLSVMTRSRMFDTLRRLGKDGVTRIDETHGREIAQAENVRGLVTASVSKFGELYLIDLKVVDPASNEYIFTGRDQAKGQERIPELIDRLSARVRVGLKENAREVRETKKNVAAATTANVEAYQHYFRADQLIDDWEFEKAEEELQQAVKLDPEFGLAWSRLAYVSAWFSNHEVGRERIAKARRFSAGAPEKERLIIGAIEKEIAGDLKSAIEIRKQILARFPDEKESIYVLGDLSFHSYDYPAARGYLERAITIDPRHERAHTHLVWTDLSVGNFPAAVEHARRFVAHASTSEARSLLVTALFQNGAYKEAVAEAQANLASHPDSVDAVVTAALHLSHSGDYAAAQEAATRLKRIPDAAKRAVYEVISAFILAEQGRWREALAMLERAAAIAKANGIRMRVLELTGRRAWILARLGKTDEARAILASIAANPSEIDGTVRDFVISTSVLLEDFDAAERHIRDTAEPGVWLGVLAFERRRASGDVAGALESARAVTRLNAWYSLGWEALAKAALAAGQYDEAARAARLMYNQAVSDYCIAEREYLLGRIEEARGNRAAARAHYQTMLSHWRNADGDIPQLVDAKARLAKL